MASKCRIKFTRKVEHIYSFSFLLVGQIVNASAAQKGSVHVSQAELQRVMGYGPCEESSPLPEDFLWNFPNNAFEVVDE